MKELIILRHAKSDWAVPFGDDADRPLNERGRAAAAVIGRVLTLAGRAPELVLSSPALRARATADLAAAAGGWDAPISVEASLSPGSPAAFVATVRARAAGAGRVLVVGHEPACSQTLSVLLGGGRVRMSTGTAAAVGVVDWNALAPGAGTLLWMLPPRLFTDSGFPLP